MLTFCIKVTDSVRNMLIQCATPEALLRLKYSKIEREEDRNEYFDQYFHKQHHDSLGDYLRHRIINFQSHDSSQGILVQVSTTSKISIIHFQYTLPYNMF